jgi:hypothetical protein
MNLLVVLGLTLFVVVVLDRVLGRRVRGGRHWGLRRKRWTRWWCGRRAHNQGGCDLHLGCVARAGLLLEQVIADEEEGGQWLVRDEDGDGMAELRVQPTQRVDDHGRIRHQVADVAQEVREVLEAAEVVVDGEVALVQAMVLLEGVDNAPIGDVEEEATYGLPDDVDRRLRNLDHLHEIESNRCIQPGHNALIDLELFGVVPHVLGIDGAIDMIDQPELAESGVEESAPSREHCGAVVEGDRHMSADVHMLDVRDGNGGGRVVAEGVLGAGDGGSRAGCHEQRGGEKLDRRRLIPYRRRTHDIYIDLSCTYTGVASV